MSEETTERAARDNLSRWLDERSAKMDADHKRRMRDIWREFWVHVGVMAAFTLAIAGLIISYAAFCIKGAQ